MSDATITFYVFRMVLAETSYALIAADTIAAIAKLADHINTEEKDPNAFDESDLSIIERLDFDVVCHDGLFDSDDWEALAMECFEASSEEDPAIQRMFLVDLALRFRLLSVETEKRERETERYQASYANSAASGSLAKTSRHDPLDICQLCGNPTELGTELCLYCDLAVSNMAVEAEVGVPEMKMGEAFPSKYLGYADLKGKEVPVTIEDVTQESMGDGKLKLVAHLKGARKALVLNKTNASRIAAKYGDDTDEWIGAQLILYPTWWTSAGSPPTASA